MFQSETFSQTEKNYQTVMKGFKNYLSAVGNKRILALLFLTVFA